MYERGNKKDLGCSEQNFCKKKSPRLEGILKLI